MRKERALIFAFDHFCSRLECGLHVAIPALYAMSARGPLRWTLWAYTAMIGLGAMALFWHYGVDVYAGAVGAAACWWVAGRSMRRA